jgi:general secretion pathway protein A
VQVILCGQPTLLTTLKSDGLSALSDRITRRVELLPLPADQVKGYIEHRLSVAGGADAVSFEADAVKVIAELSRGLPRRINVLCDRALQEGRIAGVSSIGAELVKHAARALTGAASMLPIAPVAAPPGRPIERPEVAATTLREPSFGRETSTFEPEALEAPASNRNRTIALAAAGVIAVAAAGYYWYASSTLDGYATASASPLPPAPVKKVGAPYVLRGVPSDAEIAAALAPRIFALPAPATITTPPTTPATIVTPQAPPASPSVPPASNQIP